MEGWRSADKPFPLSSRASDPREGTTHTLATVAEVESAARGFGDRSDATASRPTSGVVHEIRTRLHALHRRAAYQNASNHHHVHGVYGHTPRDRNNFGAAGESRTRIAALQGRKSAIDVRRLDRWSHRRESNARHILTKDASYRLNDDGSTSGADMRARTATFSLTRRAHCLSCSIRVAEPMGFEPTICAVTGRRGRPSSSTIPNW